MRIANPTKILEPIKRGLEKRIKAEKEKLEMLEKTLSKITKIIEQNAD